MRRRRKRYANRNLICVAAAVRYFAKFTKRRRLGVVHVMMHGLHGFQVRENSGKIFVSHAAINFRRHNWI